MTYLNKTAEIKKLDKYIEKMLSNRKTSTKLFLVEEDFTSQLANNDKRVTTLYTKYSSCS